MGCNPEDPLAMFAVVRIRAIALEIASMEEDLTVRAEVLVPRLLMRCSGVLGLHGPACS